MRTPSHPNGQARPLIRAAMLTTAAVLLGACDASAGEAPPRPTGKPSVTTCVNSSGALMADIDGDTHADRVLDPSRIGAELTIEFGKEAGYEKPVGPRKLVGGSDGGEEDVLAAVADYNGDGWSDLVIVATGKWHGDDPIDPSVAELRLGPFSATGQGQRTRALDLGEIRGSLSPTTITIPTRTSRPSPTPVTGSTRPKPASATAPADSPTPRMTHASAIRLSRTGPMTTPPPTCPDPV